VVLSPTLQKLITSLRLLPGIGQKSAQRIVFYLLEHQRDKSIQLAENILDATKNIKNCINCRNFTEYEKCQICSDKHRNGRLLCVVESPADVLAIEQMGHYHGLYFVLMGHLSPLDGIGPKELHIDQLQRRLIKKQPSIMEVILATNPTVEGEATAHYITQLARNRNIKTTRIAHGVPLGSELEYIGSDTLTRAFSRREEVD